MKESIRNVEFGFSIEPKGASPKMVQQVHGNRIVSLTAKATENTAPENADGISTQALDTPIHIFTADCIPLLYFSDERQTPILAVHCGWRGANLRIAKMASVFFQKPTVVIGPSILKCCFEVKEDLIEAFKEQGHSLDPFLTKAKGKIFFDLPEFVVQTQLPRTAQIIRKWNRCTFCSHPLLPSYRRNKGTDPQIRAWIVRKALPSHKD